MYKLFVATLAMLATGSVTMLMAQENEPGMQEGLQMMEKWDTDGNGEISKDEFMQAHEEMFEFMDENGNGTLDREEHEAMMQKMRHHKRGDMDHHEKMEDMEQRR